MKKVTNSPMINLLLISTSRSRTKYFTKLQEGTKLNITIYKAPFSLRGLKYYFRIKKDLNFNAILEEKFKEIELKYQNSIYKFIYKNYIRTITPIIASSYYEQIKKNNIEIVGIWNGKKFPEIIATTVAKFLNIKTLYFENGLFPNTTVVDPIGVNATNSLPKELDFYKNYSCITTLPKELNVRKALREKIEGEKELPKNYVFVPFQTNFDTQIVYHGRWIKSMETLFNLIDEVSRELKINFIIKEHPSERQMDYTHLHQKAANNPYLSFANTINTQELIEKSSAIVTINSSVGLEGLLFNKRVVVLGEAFYDIEGLTKSADSKEQLQKILHTLNSWSVNREDIQKFLTYILNEYLIKDNWKTPTKVHFKEFEKRVKEIIGNELHSPYL